MAKRWKVIFEPKLDPRFLSFLLNRIDAFAHFLREMPMAPGEREELDRLNIIRAIRGTTGIEGNRLDEELIEEVLIRHDDTPLSLEEQEVLNAEAVMKYIRSRKPMPYMKLTETIIKEIHAQITLDCNYKGNVIGEYRTTNVRAGAYICPSAGDVGRLMREFTEFINSSESLTMHPVVRAVISHFYLVAIHPFTDGNGRTARAAEAYLLYHGGYSRAGFYSLANYYYKHRGEYVDEMDKAMFEHNGSLRNFVLFALEGFESEMEDRYRETNIYIRKLAYRQYLDELVRKEMITPRLAGVLTRMSDDGIKLRTDHFKQRVLPWLAETYRGLSERSVRHDLTIMRKLNLVYDTKGIIRVDYHAVEPR
ncbi:MAG: Fic family protein [Actinomycetota bacterium]